MPYFNINTMNYKTTVKYAARASTVDILLKTNLAVRPLPELEIEQEHHAQQNSSPDIRIQFMTCS
jgi:hypothetical protein